jgi:diguanylate cyclase (GGDEF)-like protein
MDTVARMGGDEFTVVLSQISEPGYAGNIAAAIIQKLSEPFVIDQSELTVSASIGITIYPTDGDNSELLLKNADKAMYLAKTNGRNRYSYLANQS